MTRLRYFLPGIFCILFCSACSLLGDPDAPRQLQFEELNVEYKLWGTWTPTYRLLIDSTGTARLFVFSWEDATGFMQIGARSLNADEKLQLSELLSYMPFYERRYEPKTPILDANAQEVILRYRGQRDTVSTYAYGGGRLPRPLQATLEHLEAIRSSISEQS